MHRQIQNKRAIALLITLWTLIIMGMLAVQLATDVRRDLLITRYDRDGLLAINLARAGVGIAVCNLKNDLLVDRDPEQRAVYDSLADIWNREPQAEKPLAAGEGEIRFDVIDEESKLNINMASGQLLHKALLYLGVEERLAPVIATAIVDWRDEDSAVNFVNEDARQAMLEIYDNLGIAAEEEEETPAAGALPGQPAAPRGLNEKRFYGYAPRNERILVLEELLDVWGVTQTLLYGYDPLYDRPPAHPFPVLEGRETAPRHFDKFGLGLRHLFTTAPTDGLNLNTANFDALAAYFFTAYEEERQAYDMARKVVEWRESAADRFYKSEPHVFKSMDDFTQIPGLPNLLQGQLQQHHRVAVTSANFSIFAQGAVRGSKAFVGARVARSYESFPLEREEGVEQASQEAAAAAAGGNVPPDASNEDDFLFVPTIRCVQWSEW